MRSSLALASLLLLLLPSSALANAMAPWWPCDGLAAGDACGDGTYYDGVCELQPSCTDDTGTDVNECLHCIGTVSSTELGPIPDAGPAADAASADVGGSDTAAGPDTGAATPTTTSDDDGCSAAHATTSLGLLMLLGLGLVAVLRRRRAV